MGLFDGIGGMFGSGDHSSVLGALGGKLQKWTDPLAMIPGGFGDKWSNLTSNTIPGMVNKVGSKVITPFDKVDETINPVRQIPIVDRIGDAVRDKPGDAAALAAGAYFAAPALAGAAGGGGAGAGSGAVGGIGAGGMTAAPGVSLAGGGTALGSTAGLSGSFAPVLGGGGAFAGGVASGVQTGTPMTGDVSGMTGQWGDVGNGNMMNGLTRSVQNLNSQQQQGQQKQAQDQSQGERMLAQWLAQARASQMASALRSSPAIQGQQLQSAQLFKPVG